MNAQTAYSAHPIHSYIFSAVENAFEIEHNKKIVQFSSGTPEERKAFLDGFARLQAPFKPPESSSQVNIGKIPGNILIDTDVSAMQTEATIRGAEEEKKSRRRSASPEPFRVRAVLSRERERERSYFYYNGSTDDGEPVPRREEEKKGGRVRDLRSDGLQARGCIVLPHPSSSCPY